MDDFLGVFIASSKHEEGWKNSRQLCQTLIVSQVCITFENFPNPREYSSYVLSVI